MKVCNACGETKPLEDFPVDRKRPSGRYPNCKICHAAYERSRYKNPEIRAKKNIATKRWSERNRDRLRELSRANHLKRKYGLTPEERDAMLVTQRHRCALCGGGSPRTRMGWQVEHDHTTGRVRGIVCQSCNHLIGLIEAGWSPPSVERIRHYLEAADAVGEATESSKVPS